MRKQSREIRRLRRRRFIVPACFFQNVMTADKRTYTQEKCPFFFQFSRFFHAYDKIQPQFSGTITPSKARASPYPPASIPPNPPAARTHRRQGAYPFLLPLLITQPQNENAPHLLHTRCGGFRFFHAAGVSRQRTARQSPAPPRPRPAAKAASPCRFVR